MKEILGAEDLDMARLAIASFARDYCAKHPKAVVKIIDDADAQPEAAQSRLRAVNARTWWRSQDLTTPLGEALPSPS